MKRRTRQPRRLWAARAALLIAVATFGGLGAAQSLGFRLHAARPAQALNVNRWDARAMGGQALLLAQPGRSAADRQEAGRLAKAALRRDPTVVPAVNALAFLAVQRGQGAQARSLFGYAMALSRRDLQSQLWAIEDAVARGNVTQALVHYDTALRTSGRAADLLFPVLSQAITVAPVRSALIARMAERPLWSEAFISHAADRGPDFPAVALLFTGLQQQGVTPPPYARAALIGRLVEQSRIDDAWRFYATTDRGAQRARSRDPRFTVAPSDPTAFDWTTIGDGGVAASIQGSGGQGALVFSAPPSVGGALVRQMQVLPPGRYRLDGRSVGIDQPQASLPYWSLTCIDGRELGRVEMPASGSSGGRFTGILTVPTGCPVQWLTLVARPSEATTGLSGTVEQVQLHPDR